MGWVIRRGAHSKWNLIKTEGQSVLECDSKVPLKSLHEHFKFFWERALSHRQLSRISHYRKQLVASIWRHGSPTWCVLARGLCTGSGVSDQQCGGSSPSWDTTVSSGIVASPLWTGWSFVLWSQVGYTLIVKSKWSTPVWSTSLIKCVSLLHTIGNQNPKKKLIIDFTAQNHYILYQICWEKNTENFVHKAETVIPSRKRASLSFSIKLQRRLAVQLNSAFAWTKPPSSKCEHYQWNVKVLCEIV